LTPDWYTHWESMGFHGLIVQCVGEFVDQQCSSAISRGWDLAGYVWNGYPERLSMFDPYKDNMAFIADDIEMATGLIEPTIGNVNNTLAACDDYLGIPAWIYTGKWVFDQLNWSNQSTWSNRNLWVSIYDGKPDIDVGFSPFGGWTHADMKQFTSTPIDLNVFRQS
jgi:hypothetical protein